MHSALARLQRIAAPSLPARLGAFAVPDCRAATNGLGFCCRGVAQGLGQAVAEYSVSYHQKRPDRATHQRSLKPSRYSAHQDAELERVQTLDSFVRYFGNVKFGIFKADVAQPCIKLATLLQAEGVPTHEWMQHPAVTGMQDALRYVLDRKNWNSPDDEDKVPSGDPVAQPTKPYFRTRFRASEIACLMKCLVQYKIDTSDIITSCMNALLVADTFKHLNASDLAKVLWSLNYASHKLNIPEDLKAALNGQIPPQIPFMDAATVCAVAYGCFCLNVGTPTHFAALVARLIVTLRSIQKNSLPPALFASALTAFAGARIRAGRYVAATGSGYGFGSIDDERELCDYIIGTMSSMDALTVATIAKAAGTMGLSLPDSTMRSLLALNGSVYHSLPPAEGPQGGDELWFAVEDRVLQLLPSLSTTDVSFVAASFARANRLLGLEAMKHEQGIRVALRELKSKHPAKHIASGHSALDSSLAPEVEARIANVGPLIGTPVLWKALHTALLSQDLRSITPQVASHVAWAFTRVNLQSDDLFEHLTNRMSAVVSTSTSSDVDAGWAAMCANLLNAYYISGYCRREPHEGMLASLLTFTARTIFEAVPDTPQAASSLPRAAKINPSDLAFLALASMQSAGLLGPRHILAGSDAVPAEYSTTALHGPVRQLIVSVALRINVEAPESLERYQNDAIYRFMLCGMTACSHWAMLASRTGAERELPTGNIIPRGDKMVRDPEAGIIGDAVTRLREILAGRGIPVAQQNRVLNSLANGRRFRGSPPSAVAATMQAMAQGKKLGLRPLMNAWGISLDTVQSPLKP